MWTMRAKRKIVLSQHGAHADGHGLLTDIEVQGRGYFALQKECIAPLFESANEQHLAVKMEHAGDRCGRNGGSYRLGHLPSSTLRPLLR